MRELTVDSEPADDDGYTLDRYIAAAERLYDAVSFSFRPVDPIGRAKIIDGKRKLNEQQTVVALSKVLTQRVTKWDAKSREGELLPITVHSCVKLLHPVVLSRLFDIVVFSVDGGDEHPNASYDEEDVQSIPDLLADDGGPGLIEAEQKN